MRESGRLATKRWVEDFDSTGDPTAAAARTAILALLARGDAVFRRATFTPGHITASAIVLAPGDDRVLMVFHRRLGRWLQPGGHVEAEDESPYATARREVAEETGVELESEATPLLLTVDVHVIPAARGEPEHLHHDLMFFGRAKDERLRGSPEARAVVWRPIDNLGDASPDDAFRRGLARARELVR